MKPLIFLIIIFLSVVLQVSFFPMFKIFNNHYEILFSLTIFIALRYSWQEGAIAGIFFGLLNDIFSLSSFGMSSFVYSIIGFFSGFFQNIMFVKNIVSKLFILFLMSIAAGILTIFLLQGSDALFEIWTKYKIHLLSISCINALFSLPLYYLLDYMTYDKKD